jgi:vancomycin resistance protein YoaR
VAVIAAWAIDARVHRHEVLPNASLAGNRVRGMSPEALTATVHEVAQRLEGATVEVRSPDGTFTATVPELGLEVDEEGTVAAALRAGRTGGAPGRLFRWARSFVDPVEIPVSVTFDQRALDHVVAERDPGRTPPAEPFLALQDGRLMGRPGRPGHGLRPADVAAAIQRADVSESPIVVSVRPRSLPPRFAEEEAQALAATAERLAGGGLVVAAGSQTAAVPAEVVRLWVQIVPTEDGLRLGLKPDADVAGNLADLLAQGGVRPVDASFTVSDGQVSIVPPRPGTACCAPEAVGIIDAALAADVDGSVGPLDLPLRSVPARRDEEAARRLGIVEVVGSFTTPHAGGEPRVDNIHRMADLLRGTVIEPGGTFSINGIVGPRTREKGFVEAPIIGADYLFESDVGGGVSQFATTMFNAAFFAGLDITEYSMHGLYISRYPYGREATLSFPGPDLKVRNSTPYGVLVWPTYTGTSITVTLYSTKTVEGSQTGQRTEARPVARVPDELEDEHAASPFTCTAVTTERTRSYLADGRTVVDRFFALYSPREGVVCA